MFISLKPGEWINLSKFATIKKESAWINFYSIIDGKLVEVLAIVFTTEALRDSAWNKINRKLKSNNTFIKLKGEWIDISTFSRIIYKDGHKHYYIEFYNTDQHAQHVIEYDTKAERDSDWYNIIDKYFEDI